MIGKRLGPLCWKARFPRHAKALDAGRIAADYRLCSTLHNRAWGHMHFAYDFSDWFFSTNVLALAGVGGEYD